MVELRFDGKRYGYWQRVSIRESVDDLCAVVQLGIAKSEAPLMLGVNTVAEVLVDGTAVTTVRAGKVRRRVGKDSHAIQFEARSLARELVDCQYSKTLKGLRVDEVIKRICETFKVPFKSAVNGKTAVVPEFSMQCEVPANALLNAARVANLLLYPTPDGGLILSEPDNSAPVAVLEYGKHFTVYDVLDDYDRRFSDYVVKSFDYEGGSALTGDAKDSEFTFFRPLHIVADRHGGGIGACKRRAELERARRLARAHSITLTLPSWSHSAGLYAVNTQVRVVIQQEGVDDTFLIGDREFSLDDQGGSITQLTVMRRDAFLNEPKLRKKRSAGARK